MLTEILSQYTKMHNFRGTLWKTELKVNRIIAWLFGFHGDMAVLCMNVCYTY